MHRALMPPKRYHHRKGVISSLIHKAKGADAIPTSAHPATRGPT